MQEWDWFPWPTRQSGVDWTPLVTARRPFLPASSTQLQTLSVVRLPPFWGPSEWPLLLPAITRDHKAPQTFTPPGGCGPRVVVGVFSRKWSEVLTELVNIWRHADQQTQNLICAVVSNCAKRLLKPEMLWTSTKDYGILFYTRATLTAKECRTAFGVHPFLASWNRCKPRLDRSGAIANIASNGISE